MNERGPDQNELSGKGDPGPRGGADGEAAMDSLDQGRAPLPDSADDPRVVELLARWDELPDEGRANLARHPVHGPRLAQLQEVESWLDEQSHGCPEAEELYDFARGPGFVALAYGRRQEIADHLDRCAECEALVDSLQSSPPLPLDLTGEPEEVAEPHRGAQRGSLERVGDEIARRRAMRWIPRAAAAAVLVGGVFLMRGGEVVDADGGWPTAPLLRGEASVQVLFPRGPVLAEVPSDAALGFASRPTFEIAPIEGAESYRVVLRHHAGGAFERGEPVATLTDEAPTLVLEEPLVAGHYTWEGWATVDGLERVLGERDFRVVENADLATELGALDPVARVRRLHEAGFLTDARALARRASPSPERDAYLAAPGR